jgi:hypothetical protein
LAGIEPTPAHSRRVGYACLNLQLERQAQWQPSRATTRPPDHALIWPLLRARRQPGECSSTCILIHFSRTGKHRLCSGDSFRPGGPGLRTGPGRTREDPDEVTWIRGANHSRDLRVVGRVEVG